MTNLNAIDNGSNEIDVPTLTPGQRVLVQLRDESYHRRNDDGTYTEVFLLTPPTAMTVRDADRCWPNVEAGDPRELIDEAGPDQPHLVTMCPGCVDSWAQDHLISLVESPHDLGLTR